MTKPFVVIESPYAGDVERNVRYARACLKDSLMRGEAPFAGHLLYTQVLDDTVPEQRDLGVQAHIRVLKAAVATVVYCDLGVSPGMQLAIDAHMSKGFRTDNPVYRRLWPALEQRDAGDLSEGFKQRFLSDAELDRLLTEAGV